MRWAFMGVALVLVAGCKLVDQTSFGGAPRRPVPTELAQALASHGGLPLLVIRPDENVPYADELRRAVEGVDAGDGSARFRVVAAVAATDNLATDSSALEANGNFARQVLDDMQADGVTADRLTLTARAEAHLGAREIRVYQVGS